jgi:L-alanine-DL-glutamate epimerase-like enolase superfamily enzyme
LCRLVRWGALAVNRDEHGAGVTDLWAAVRQLPIIIESFAMEALRPSGPTTDGDYSSTQLRLRGRGEEGVGEQVGLERSQDGLRASDFPLVGEWATLEEFLTHLDGIEMWPGPPELELERNWRRWAFESAALDLALRQAATSLPEVLGRRPRPVTFVTSFGLGDPPEAERVRRRRAMHPTVGFKLDVTPAWTQEIMKQVADVDGVATIDFKGQYGHTVADWAALVAMYERALDAFGDEVTLEDPHDDPTVLELLAPVAYRVCYDAPITSVESIAATPIQARIVNVKPCRIGRLRELSRLYAHCESAGIRMYNGGMGELGVGRGQAQLLAALFHPDAPNDIAPSDYNLLAQPAALTPSPLDPSADRGFRRR